MNSCKVCLRRAQTHNYGVITCDACKMFFRRSSILKNSYVCRRENRCFELSKRFLQCQSCRLQRCMSVGMVFIPRDIVQMRNKRFDEMTAILSDLEYKNSRRECMLMNKFTSEDVSFEQLVAGMEWSMRDRNSHTKRSVEEWNYSDILTTGVFLLGFDFMKKLEPDDKILLIRNFVHKAASAFQALRSGFEKSLRLITPDGEDLIPDALERLFEPNSNHLQLLRSYLISKFVDLNVTSEEFLLVLTIFFCNPAVHSLSADAKKTLTDYQLAYNSALFHHCQLKHQQTASSRFTDLLSLCHVINRNCELMQSMLFLFQFYRPNHKLNSLVKELGI